MKYIELLQFVVFDSNNDNGFIPRKDSEKMHCILGKWTMNVIISRFHLYKEDEPDKEENPEAQPSKYNEKLYTTLKGMIRRAIDDTQDVQTAVAPKKDIKTSQKSW